MTQDLYGLDLALDLAMELFERGSRRSGRTERMIAMVKPGDRVITATAEEAQRLRRLLRDRGVENVDVVAGQPAGAALPHQARLASARRPTVADHAWVYARFQAVLEREARSIRDEISAITGEQIGMPAWPEAAEVRRDVDGTFDWKGRRE